MNRLYFGDNLAWLRNTKEFPDASVDLVYIAVRIRGDSAAPRYVAGDIAILAVSDPPKSDDLVIAKLRDEGIVFKKLQIVDPHKHLFRFITFNEQYAPMDRTAAQIVWIYPVDSVIQKLRR